MSLTNIRNIEQRILSKIGEDYDIPAVANGARDMIDAGTNVLCRLEGHRAAAAFAFALSDRMVAGVIGQPTEAPIYLPSISTEMPRAATEMTAHKVLCISRAYLAIGIIIGCVVGFVAGRAL